jgi:hypothetical protein
MPYELGLDGISAEAFASVALTRSGDLSHEGKDPALAPSAALAMAAPVRALAPAGIRRQVAGTVMALEAGDKVRSLLAAVADDIEEPVATLSVWCVSVSAGEEQHISKGQLVG